MQVYDDQIGNEIRLSKIPKRIVSLVPSQSEYLWDLGLQQELLGITKFCIHPDTMYRTVERIGGTKKLDLEKILALKPDLVIGNKEENELSDIKFLQQHCKVWMSDIVSIEDAYQMMLQIGAICGRKGKSEALVTEIRNKMEKVKDIFGGKRAAYFMWKSPYMLAASKTFINAVMQHSGLLNVVSHRERYPVVDLEELIKINPEFCLLSSEPFPFKEKDLAELNASLPAGKIILVDGEFFSWYGSRLKLLPDYLEVLKLKMK